MKPDPDSPLEDLQRTIDTPSADLSGSFTRAGFHKEVHEVPEVPADWAHEHGEQNSILTRMRFTKKHKTLATWLFGVAIVFFVIALGIAAFFLTGSRNVLTADKIDIEVTGRGRKSAACHPDQKRKRFDASGRGSSH
jgi:hypothetical protein